MLLLGMTIPMFPHHFSRGMFFQRSGVSVVPGCILYPDDAIFNGKKANRTKGYDVSCEGRNTP